MNTKYITLSACCALAAGCAYAESTVSVSGGWNNSQTWSEGAIPTTSSSAPLDKLLFGESGLALDINGSQYVSTIDIGANKESSIDIGDGASLTMLNSSNSNFFTSSSSKNKLTISGEGTLILNGPGQKNFVKGDYVLDVNTKSYTNIYWQDGGGGSTVTFKKDFTSTGQISIGGGWNFNIESGSTITVNSAFNNWGSTSTLNMATGSKIVVNNGGFGTSNGNIDGDIISKGFQNYDGNRYAAKFINTTFGINASVTQTSGGNMRTILGGNIVSNAATGKLSFANKVSFNDRTVITLNSSNAILAGGAATQATSDFYLMNQIISGSYPNRYETLGAAEVSMILNAANDFGNFLFYEGSKLKLTTNGHRVNIGGLGFAEGGSTLSVELYNLTDFTVKINSLDNINLMTDDDGKIRAEDIYVADAEGLLDNAYIFEDSVNGGWWINSTGAIPEPSEFAVILGALAILVAAARRNK